MRGGCADVTRTDYCNFFSHTHNDKILSSIARQALRGIDRASRSRIKIARIWKSASLQSGYDRVKPDVQYASACRPLASPLNGTGMGQQMFDMLQLVVVSHHHATEPE